MNNLQLIPLYPPSVAALPDAALEAHNVLAAMSELVLIYDSRGDCLQIIPTQGARDGGDPRVYCIEAFFENGVEVRRVLQDVTRTRQLTHVECRRRLAPDGWYSATVTLIGQDQLLLVGREGERKISQGNIAQKLAEAMTQVHETNERLLAQVKQLEARNRSIELLGEMASLLQACAQANEVYEIVGRFLRQLFPESSGALAVIRDSRNLVEEVSRWGTQLNIRETFEPVDCWSLRSGRLHDSVAHPICGHLAVEAWAGRLCVPMLAQGEALGMLYLQTSEVLSEAQRGILAAATEQIGLALANLKLRLALRDLSIRDVLTGLFNRRYLEETLDRELARARRSAGVVSVIMFDVDHFKRFNDTWGHEAGDELLRALGVMVVDNIREGDIACRYGGEEFLIILPGAPLAIANRRAEELRITVRNTLRLKVGNATANITLSLGVAAYPKHGATPAALVKAADEALYAAKHSGRDQVVVAG